MGLQVTDYAIAHLVESVELTMGGASLAKREETFDRVLKGMQSLLEWPKAGQVEIWMEGKEYIYRRLVIGNFKVIYRIDAAVVYVTDIFDMRQDPKRMKG
ncbi:MAG: hypothetical protein ABIQ75_10860 [Flavobacteriales bacterium]